MNNEDIQIALKGARDSLSIANDFLKTGNVDKASSMLYQSTMFVNEANDLIGKVIVEEFNAKSRALLESVQPQPPSFHS